MMKCEVCGTRESVIHVQQIIGNETVDVHLCEACAHEKGISQNNDKIELSLSQLLTGLLKVQEGESQDSQDECDVCGTKIADFKTEGRLGCPECYTTFATEIRKMHNHLSGTTRHRGKLPQSLKTYKELLIDRQRLKSQLTDAIKNEDYEAAAMLRDQIRSIEKAGENPNR